MNPGPLVFLATFFAMAVSWLGFVLAPELQLGNARHSTTLGGDPYPSMRSGMARQGEQVYRANGCFYCHTQQVRHKGFGSDVARQWGGRPGKIQSVNEDYLYDTPVMLGSQRVGPDLANYGLRMTNETTILMHLYDPQLTMPKTVMPPFAYLFEKRAIKPGGKASADALPVKLGKDFEVIPTDEARQLAAYLMSLHSDGIIPDAPPGLPPVVKTNAVAAAASAPAATNSPAKK